MDETNLSEIDRLCEESLLMTYQNLTKASSLAEECLDKAEQAGYSKGIMNSRIVLSILEIYKGDLDLVRDKLSHIEQELVSQAYPDECLMYLSFVRGLYFLWDGNYRDSFDAFIRCSVLSARLGNQLFQGLSDNAKGCVKLDQQECREAFDYFKSAGSKFRSDENQVVQEIISLNMGCALHEMGESTQAETILKNTLKVSVDQGWEILECAVLDELGRMMQEQGQFDLAEEYLEEGISKSRKLNDIDIYMSLISTKARILIQKGQFGEAEKLLTEDFIEKRKDLHNPVYYQLLADIHERQGDYREALKNYKKYNELQQKLLGEEVTLSILKQENKILKESNHQLRLISTIGQELVANLDIGRILNLIYAQMNVLMPVDLLLVALVENGEINVKFALENGSRLKPARIRVDNPDSLLAWTVRNKKELFMRDSRKEFRIFSNSITRHPYGSDDLFNSIICIPLWFINEIVGVISVQSRQTSAYSNSDLENLRALSTYAGIAIRNALQTEKMNELNEVLKRQSATDSLTGLVNRREMVQQARSIWRICRRNKFWISVVMIDLDHFKKVNDIHGHTVGDAVLRKVGAILKQFFQRALDCACRYGGEELMVVTGDMTPREAAARMELIRKELENTEFEGKNGEIFKVRFSCGVYGEIPADDIRIRLTKLTSIVDSYLYMAKNNGRNCTYLSDKSDKPAERFVSDFSVSD